MAYLQDGGGSTELRRWAADQQVGGGALQRGVLEKLVEQRPVERKHILSLAGIYSIEPPTVDEMNRLAEAAELMWADLSVFDLEDCRLGLTIHNQVELTSSSLRKLLQGLVTHHPDGWRPAAIGLLTEAIQRRQADAALLTLCVERLFRADDRDAEHVWALELLSEKRDEPFHDGLRLLSLYDAGLVRPGEAATKSPILAEALAEKLAKRCPELASAQRAGLVDPLYNRQSILPAGKQPDWAIDLLVFAANAELLGKSSAVQKFIDELANHLLGNGNPAAVGLFRWLNEQSGRSVADAAILFQAANRLGGLDTKDIYWLRIARQATKKTETRSAAEEFLLEVLQDTQKWEREYLETAVDLLDSKHRLALAPVFVQRAQYGRDHHLDQKILELLDDNPGLASGDATLLLALAEQREKKRNSEGALEALYMVEDTVGGSEELARRILTLLRSSSGRAAQSGRVTEYLKRYRNSYDLLAQMVALARDPVKPLPFESAFTIVDRWAELALNNLPGQLMQQMPVSSPSRNAKCMIFTTPRFHLRKPTSCYGRSPVKVGRRFRAKPVSELKGLGMKFSSPAVRLRTLVKPWRKSCMVLVIWLGQSGILNDCMKWRVTVKMRWSPWRGSPASWKIRGENCQHYWQLTVVWHNLLSVPVNWM